MQVTWINLTAHFSLYKAGPVLFTSLKTIILDYAKEPSLNTSIKLNLHKHDANEINET